MSGAIAEAQDRRGKEDPPDAPTDLRVGSINLADVLSQDGLAWDAPTYTGSDDITGYQVQRRTTSSTIWETHEDTDSTDTAFSYQKSQSEWNTGYVYQVRAVNSHGESDWSDELTVGGAPTWKSHPGGILTATPHASLPQVTLDWAGELEHDGGKAITGWTLWWKKDSDSDWQTEDVDPDQTVVTATGLEYNTEYDFQVQAHNGHRSDFSRGSVSATTVRFSAPTDLRVTDVSDDAQDKLAWTAPTDTGGSAITDYQVQRRATTSDEWETPEDTDSTDTAFSYQKPLTGHYTGYVYRVRAVVTGGDSSLWSDEITVGGIPTWTVGEAGTPTATRHASLPQVTLDWAGKLDHDGGKSITGWTWEWKKSSDVMQSFQPGGDVGDDITSVTATGLEYNTAYDFAVRADNGHRRSVRNITDATTLGANAPTGLRVTDVSDITQDALAWTAPTDTGDSAITGYQVQRRVTTSEEWETPEDTDSADAAYTVTKAGSGHIYVYRVRAVVNGNPGAWSDDITVDGAPTWKSGAAGTPTATPHGSLLQITLDWTGKLDHDGGQPITGWTWHWKEASSADYIKGGDLGLGETVATLSGLEYNTAYDFAVVAHNGHRSSAAAETQTTTVVTGAPTNLRGAADGRYAYRDDLTWEAPTTDGGAAITGYQVAHRVATSEEWAAPINTDSTETTYEFERLNIFSHWTVAYIYRVRAVSNDKPGAWSNEFTVAGGPTWKSDAAGTPTATPHASLPQVTLDWTGKLEYDGGKAITGWRWEWKKSSEPDIVFKDGRPVLSWRQGGEVVPGTTLSIATGLEYNTSYDFSVIADNGHRDLNSQIAQATTVGANAPTGLRVTDVSDIKQDKLAWTAPTDTGGSAITDYQVQRRVTTSEGWDDPIDTGSTDAAYTVTKAGSGYSYVYRVRAVNGVNPGAWSDEITVGGAPTWRTGNEPPESEGMPGAFGEEGTFTATPHASLPQVILDWTGEVGHDGGQPITGWTWYWKKASDGDYIEGGEVGADITVVTATGLEYNTAYQFEVVAHNGHRSSLASSSATTVASSAPTELKVTDKSHQDRDGLAWAAPTETGGSGITGYQLERRVTTSDDWEASINTGSTDTAYTVTKAGWGHGYIYRVRAVSNDNPGAWSDEITVGGRPTWKSGAAGTPTATRHPSLLQITLDWAGTLNHDGGKPITGWSWRYKKASSNDWLWRHGLPAGQTSVIATGLEYDTAYDFDVVAYNEDRGSYTSDDARATTISEDGVVLAAFYNATGGDNWRSKTNWLSQEPLGRWAGVVTDDDGRVIALELPNSNLQGSLPAEIGNLSQLQQIFVHDNRGLSGPLPSSMAGMSSMKHLNATFTGLCVPDNAALRAWLDGLETAKVMDCPDDSDRAVLMEFYRATGGENWTYNANWGSDKPLHEWSGVWTNPLGRVTTLDLHGFNLTGSIPESFGNLTELRRLHLGRNNLTGPLPAGFGNLGKLEYAWLDDNKLTGPLPAELGNLANLEELYFRNNLLTGQLPNTLDGMKKLRLLYLNNQDGLSQESEDGASGLTGPIPASVGSMPSLEVLVLDRNKLTGPIPAGLANSTSLRRIAANRNQITGSIPAELGNMRQLHTLGLAHNDLSGTLPSELSNLAKLQRLSLHDNADLRGPVPAGFGGLSKLYRLAIANTGMSGTLPSSLTNLGALSEFFADGTTLCAPTDDAFQQWLSGVEHRKVYNCF